MLPRKTGPAPVFNYRKRPRQAVVADPETHPPGPSVVFKEPPSNRNTQQTAPSSSDTSNSNFGRGRGAGYDGPPPAARRSPSNTRQSTAEGNWRGPQNRQATNTSVPKKEWTGSMPARPSAMQPASPMSGPSGTKRQQTPSYQSSRSSFTGEGMSSPSVHQNAAPVKKPMPGTDQVRETRTASDRSLRVLTLPVAHVKRVFGLHSDAVPPFLLCIFGIVDSATVSDSASCGKSFTLRDETGRITCIFCEIDRQMPRLHRGQWYRAVGVARPAWQAVQCLSLRPVTMAERQAARAVISHCTSQLNDICLGVKEQ